ncbi:zinc ribbon domain-containing protein [Blastopirellula sp. J2-11]|uniref:FmdB family zinc ribbon protein n=1 Tax=Blastopirellula sp. J2-11 TaxID=2943192 RepID=UPI0021C92A25|nr:zinc ribbon domain-containing protein [Blastopirellula sp. J2-11]UUO08647.1 zinc ribbon domain-containing protein [Blastopirellula sp. J2-11]
MPLFEYVCTECNCEFETLVRGDESAACPQCGATKLEKAWSVPAAHTSGASQSLPMTAPPSSMGGCGAPQCGGGGCHLD